MNIKHVVAMAALVLGTSLAANATPISGGIGISGGVSFNDSSPIVSFVSPGVVNATSGSFITSVPVFSQVTVVGSLNDTPGKFVTPVVFFQGPNGSELELDSITSSVINGNTLTIQGTGNLLLDGYDSTIGNFTITASNNEVSVFEATAAATPEPASLALFGTGLLGVVGIARRKFNV
jgi:PEP-CTERM motif